MDAIILRFYVVAFISLSFLRITKYTYHGRGHIRQLMSALLTEADPHCCSAAI
jgi:hypothetical protein